MEDAVIGRLQDRVDALLPDAIERVLDAYRSLSAQGASEDIKEATALQNACRVTLVHLDLLIRTARATDALRPIGRTTAADGGPDLEAMLARAHRAVEIMRGPNPPPEI
jgi:hypothetical protein